MSRHVRNENPRRNVLRSGNRQRIAVEQYGCGNCAKILDSGRVAPALGGGVMEWGEWGSGYRFFVRGSLFVVAELAIIRDA